MSVPWLEKEEQAKDAAHQEKRLLVLLTEQEPDARQLLQQHLFKAATAKLDGEELNSSNFPGSAFSSIRQSTHQNKVMEILAGPSEDLECDGEPSSGLCKALDTALFITRKHGEPLHGRRTAVDRCHWQ
jgi:ParB-like chromosome segregation protein Spo0J